MSPAAQQGWQRMPLRRLAICRDDLREPVNATERANMQGDIPYWGANAIQDYVNRAKVSRPVVLVGEDGAPFYDRDKPVAFYIDEPIWPNNHIHVLFPNSGIDGRWLAYGLNAVDYSTVITGATRDKLTQGALKSIMLPVPPSDEQCAIADYLDHETAQIDALVVKQEELLTHLAERKRSVLDHVLADVDGETRRLRWLYRPSIEASKPDEEVLSVYREYGVIPKSSRTDNFNKTPENVDRYLLVRPDDLVVNKMKAWQGSLGISAHRGIVSGDYEVLRPTTPDLDPEYAHFRLRSPEMVLEYRLRSRGIRPSQWRLYWQDLADIEVIVPSLTEQRTAAARIKSETAQIDALVAKAEEHIALAKERRSALVTAAVTGQIDVRTAWKVS
ncbi:restriction endonuclease subunit S [Microbacterium sp. NPDC055903]